jgi:hypothetical protein
MYTLKKEKHIMAAFNVPKCPRRKSEENPLVAPEVRIKGWQQ